MKVYSLLYDNYQHLKEYIEHNQIDKNRKYLIKVHTSKLLKDETEVLIRRLRLMLPISEIIGCSVGGIIFKGQSLEHATLISFLDFDDTEFKTTSIPLKIENVLQSTEDIVNELLSNLDGVDNSFLFLFYPPSYPYPSSLVELLNQKGSQYKMIGGGGYSPIGDLSLERTFMIYNDTVDEDYIVCAKLKGKSLIMNQATATGIESIGKPYQVTKSSGHFLQEINHIPAKQWLHHLIGEEYLKKDINICNAFPLVRKDHEGYGLNILYDKNPYTNEDLGMNLFVFDELKENEEIMAGYISPNKSMNDIDALCNKIEKNPAEALFAYSCMTRRNILQNCAKWELQPFTSTQITGAFMAGELVWNGEETAYSNSAFTVASLSEDQKAKMNLSTHLLKDNAKLQFDNLPLINYIFSTANSELKQEMEENQMKFAEQLVTDPTTGLPNLSKFIFDCEQMKYNCLCLMSLKNDNIIRVFLNKSHFVNYIKTMVNGVKKILGNQYFVYLYNDLSILIAGCDDKQELFIQKMQDLRSYLNQVKYKEYIPIYELSIVFGEEDLLKKIELVQLNLHKDSRDIMVFTEDENKVNFNHEIHMLQVINDAISYGRVIPFYQGIYNNRTKRIEICESLMRISDQNGKIYNPSEFLEIAKEYKLYERLSKMMIEQVFKAADEHPFYLTINLNVQDIYNYDILKLIFNNMKKSKHPDKFIFEIVEGEKITDYNYLKEFTNKIHSLGGKIAIDDFGAGYSNLLHILKIDVDYLKITGEIVKEICSDKSCQEFVSMISNWGNSRGKPVIAEYVENEAIQNKIVSYDVTYSQGYLFSIPHELYK